MELYSYDDPLDAGAPMHPTEGKNQHSEIPGRQ
jgi:hypothetical protein